MFRADPKKLPAYVGVETPAGYSLVQVSKVIDLEKVDDAQREALAGALRDAVAAEELESSLASLREQRGRHGDARTRSTKAPLAARAGVALVVHSRASRG